MKRLAWLMMAVLLCAGFARAELSVATIFSDHMVLQRERPVPIWGRADAGTKVTVEFAGQKKVATADKAGLWMVKLNPMKASSQGRPLVVSDPKTPLPFADVVVGEVWLCTGQSNMDYEVAGGRRGKRSLLATFDAQANYPAIRNFTVSEKSAALPQEAVSQAATWQVCSPKTVGTFSAVGYFFGRMLHEETGVPIGLITSAVGGTKIDSWARARDWG